MTMKDKCMYVLAIVAMCAPIMLWGQGAPNLAPHIPTSPQAEAIKRYGEHSINPSTGVPDISIPLYEIDHRGYKVPVSLKYYPQPLKPGYNYDVYGHGWGLSVQSAISRSIEFVPDEWRGFRIEQEALDHYYYICPGCAESCFNDIYCHMQYEPHTDFMYNLAHDKFNGVLPDGSSFDFIIDFGGNGNPPVFTVLGGRKVKITCSYNSANIYSFTVVDEDGIKYLFEGSDIPFGGTAPTQFRQSFVSWQLKRIDLPYSTEPITFMYSNIVEDPYGQTCNEPGTLISGSRLPTLGAVNQPPTVSLGAAAMGSPVSTSTYYKMDLLSEINYGGSRIRLTYENSGKSAHNFIKKIMVYDASKLVKEISFDMTLRDNLHNPCLSANKLAKLDKITVNGPNTSENPQEYRFSYPYTDYYFSGTDHWGYFNDFSNRYDVANFNLFVGFSISDFPNIINSARIAPVQKVPQDLGPYDKIKISEMSNSDVRQPSGANRHGILSRITYPTGGYTDFEFENHRILTSTDHNGNFIYDFSNRRMIMAGGFRIKRMTSFDANGAKAKEMSYQYGKTYGELYGPDHVSAKDITGWGEAVVDPNVLTYLNYNFFASFNPNIHAFPFIRNMVLGLSPEGERISFLNPFDFYPLTQSIWKWECHFNASNFRKILNGRPPVLYPKVSVFYDGIDAVPYSPESSIGKTVYIYDITGLGTDLLGNTVNNIFIEHPRYFANTLDYVPQNYEYNKLKEKLDYKFNGQDFDVVKKEEMAYFSHTTTNPMLYVYSNPYPASIKNPYHRLGNYFSLKHDFRRIRLLQQKTTTLYGNSGVGIVTTEEYSYNDRHQVNKKRTMNSLGQLIEKSFLYPTQDYSGPGSTVMEKMLSKNMIAPVIESKVEVSGQVRSGAKTVYGEFPSGDSTIIMPVEAHDLEIDSSVPSNWEYVLKSEALDYSSNGNPLEVAFHDGPNTSYIWGYNDRYLVAKAKGASRTQVAFTSFEEEGQDNWSYNTSGTISAEGKTGNRCYSGTVSKTGLPIGDYVVSLWAKGNGSVSVNGTSKTVSSDWAMYEWELANTGSVNISSGGNLIDELRLHPLGAQMTTYTYEPLIGMTSETDPNGESTYYEYDGMNRLRCIKDANGHILQQYSYHYAGQ